jgi:hypothetical protein
MERELAAAIGQRDHLLNRNGELQMELDAAKAKLDDIESMQCTQCAIRESMCDDLSAANQARAKAEDAVKRRDGVIEEMQWRLGESCPPCIKRGTTKCHGIARCADRWREWVAKELEAV